MLWHTHCNGKAFLMTNLQQNFRSIAYFTIWMYAVYKKIYIFVFFYVSKFAANFLKYYIFDQWSVRRSRKKCIFVIFVCFQNLRTFSNTVKLYKQRIHVSKMKKLSSGAKVTVFLLAEHGYAFEEGYLYTIYYLSEQRQRKYLN